jgi:hypothetical protein
MIFCFLLINNTNSGIGLAVISPWNCIGNRRRRCSHIRSLSLFLQLGLTLALNFVFLSLILSFVSCSLTLSFVFCSLSLSRRVVAGHGVNDAPMQSLLHLHSHHLPIGLESNRGRGYMGAKHCAGNNAQIAE